MLHNPNYSDSNTRASQQPTGLVGLQSGPQGHLPDPGLNLRRDGPNRTGSGGMDSYLKLFQVYAPNLLNYKSIFECI